MQFCYIFLYDNDYEKKVKTMMVNTSTNISTKLTMMPVLYQVTEHTDLDFIVLHLYV